MKSQDTKARILGMMEETETKAWLSLQGYKFYMFGYYAASWVKLNKCLPEPLPNPFKSLVEFARR